MNDGDFLFNLFVQETKEHLDKMMECILNLQKNNNSVDDIVSLFRFVHTIKGSSAAMNYTRTSKLLHRLEDVMQKIRDGTLKMNEKHIAVLFISYDYLENFIEVVSSGGDEQTINMDHIFAQFSTFDEMEEIPKTMSTTEVIEKPVKNDTNIFSADEIYQSLINKELHNLYILCLVISEDCSYLDVKKWEIFEDVENIAEIIVSIPKRISAEEFKTTGYDSDSMQMLFMINSKMDLVTLECKLEEDFVEVEGFYLEPIEFDAKQGGEFKVENENIRSKLLEFDSLNRIYKFNSDVYQQIMDSKKTIQNTEISTNKVNGFDSNYVFEIDENINNALAILTDLGFDLNSHALLEDLYRTVLTINELAGYIENDMIFEISKEATNLMELCLHNKKIFDKQVMNIVFDTVELTKKVNLTNVIENKEVIDQISSQINIIKDNSNMTNVKSEKNQKSSVLLDEKPTAIANKSDVNKAENVQADNKVAQHENKAQAFIRIPEQKVDNLVDMMGELIILQSLIKESIIKSESNGNCKKDNNVDSLVNKMERMERIIKNLQTTSMSFRMVSLKAAFQKILRAGMETARELHKNIDFEVVGDETEIDRSVVEKINDPLLHLIRNAVSHGIEDEEHRKISQKPSIGKIQIKAYNRKGNVNIEISDDGKGLNLDEILKKAISKNIALPSKTYTENEIISFIFHDGISTQENVNSISGRGIGMNVVESEIKKLGGRIEVKNHTGVGCNFILKIPINMATINGTIIEISGYRYIIPTLNIKQIFKPTVDDWVKVKNTTTCVKNRNQILSIIPIDWILGYNEEELMNQEILMVVLEYDNHLKAMPVNAVIGKQEVVIKPIGAEFQHLKFVSGATILGDGGVSLILDVESIFS